MCVQTGRERKTLRRLFKILVQLLKNKYIMLFQMVVSAVKSRKIRTTVGVQGRLFDMGSIREYISEEVALN